MKELLKSLDAYIEYASANTEHIRKTFSDAAFYRKLKDALEASADRETKLLAENAALRARVAELEQQCTKCGGNKVVSTTTNTFACLCLDPYSCALCRGTGQYEVTAITDCDQCKPEPKEEV